MKPYGPDRPENRFLVNAQNKARTHGNRRVRARNRQRPSGRNTKRRVAPSLRVSAAPPQSLSFTPSPGAAPPNPENPRLYAPFLTRNGQRHPATCVCEFSFSFAPVRVSNFRYRLLPTSFVYARRRTNGFDGLIKVFLCESISSDVKIKGVNNFSFYSKL
ncbi:hypothetical protein EVAR_6107_1 [Eumeta japonica]|uniref:Uncharacterized protein n=1 Tax=Eumeta variegata TaxID=151549 RepID=A0A4C1TH83_EUMVA|nr:hypothetical protein EVAR_6107_1 [Eumeta japonica]